MATGFKFFNGNSQITQAGDQGNAKSVVYEDNKGNNYTLSWGNKQLQNVNLQDLILNTTYKYSTKDGAETTVKDLGEFIVKFKESLKGDIGPRGADGTSGTGPTSAEVAAALLKETKENPLVKAVLDLKEGGKPVLATSLVTDKKVELGKAVLDLKEGEKPLLAEQIKADGEFKNSLKGQDGKSPTLAEVATELLNETNKKALGEVVLDVKKGEKPLLAEQLKSYYELKGVDGTGPTSAEVAAALLNDTNENALGKAVLAVEKEGKPLLAEQLKSYYELKGVDGTSLITDNQDSGDLPDSWANLI